MEFFGFTGEGEAPFKAINRAALQTVVKAREEAEAKSGSPFNSLSHVQYTLNTPPDMYEPYKYFIAMKTPMPVVSLPDIDD